MNFDSRYKSLLFFLFLFSLLNDNVAQDTEIGMGLGVAYYQGDLVNNGPVEFKETSLAYGFHVRHHITDKWAIRANVLTGKISGDDVHGQPDRGLRFNSGFLELGAIVQYNLFGGYTFSYNGRQDNLFNLYLLMGIAYTAFDPKLTGLVDQNGDPVEFSKNTIAIPVGGGLRLNLTDRTSIFGELGVRYTFSDALDGFVVGGANDYYTVGTVGVSLIVGNY